MSPAIRSGGDGTCGCLGFCDCPGYSEALAYVDAGIGVGIVPIADSLYVHTFSIAADQRQYAFDPRSPMRGAFATKALRAITQAVDAALRGD